MAHAIRKMKCEENYADDEMQFENEVADLANNLEIKYSAALFKKAIVHGRVNIVDSLIRLGVNPSFYDSYPWDSHTPIGDALLNNRDDIVKFLIIMGADNEGCIATDYEIFSSPISYCINHGRYDLVDFIIKNCGVIYEPYVIDYTDLHCSERNFILSLKILSAHGIRIPVSPLKCILHYSPKVTTFIFGEFWNDLHPRLRFEDDATLVDVITRACAVVFPGTDIGINARYYCTRDRVALTKLLVLARYSPESPFFMWIFPVDLLKVIAEMCYLFMLPGEWKSK